MKKRNDPESDQLKALIVDAERLEQLGKDRDDVDQRLTVVTGSLRSALYSATHEAPDPNKSLDALFRELSRMGVRDNAVEVLKNTRNELVKQYTELSNSIKAGRERLRPLVSEICRRIHTMKLGEYEKLIREISEKLRPYCGTDEDQARALAEETPAAVDLFGSASRCRPEVYSSDSFLPALQATLSSIES